MNTRAVATQTRGPHIRNTLTSLPITAMLRASAILVDGSERDYYACLLKIVLRQLKYAV
jgi:hypothetical protein